jgi:hypothetical protein
VTTAEAREGSVRQIARHDTPAVEALLGRRPSSTAQK